jgi:arylsulfatase A-like enzyme
MHGFDEFFGNLYHLNAEEEPEHPDYPKDPEFKKRFGPRGVLHCWADGKGGQTIEDTGPLTKKRMETIDDEVTAHALRFIDEGAQGGQALLPLVQHHGDALPHPPAEKHKGKSGQGDYNDVMVAHDENIGMMLDKLDELGIADDTIVMYSTDNGVHYNTWPDAGITPFRSRRTPTGKAAGACRASCAGPASSRPARCSTASSPTRTGCRPSWRPRACPTSRRSCSRAQAGDKTYKVTSTASTCCRT